MSRTKKQLSKSIPWWLWILVINVVLVVSTSVHHKFVLTDQIHFFLRQIDLAIEMNFAAWWSGVLLLALGLLAYEIACDNHEKSKLVWLLLAISWTSLSLDEIGSIHERIEDWLPAHWLHLVDPYVPIAVLGALFVPYPIIRLLQKRHTRITGFWLLAGFLLFASIAVQERLEGLIDWGDWWSLRIGLEEGTELLGMLLCYCGLVNHTWKGNSPKGFSGVLPNPLRMKHLPAIVCGGLWVHLAISGAMIWGIEAPFSEHTLVWYPLALSCLLALSAFWRYRRTPDRLAGTRTMRLRSLGWLALSAYLLAYSSVVAYVIPLTTHKADAHLSAHLFSFYGLQLGFIILLWGSGWQVFPRTYGAIVALGGSVLVASLSPEGMTVRYALPAIFTFLIFRVFFPKARMPRQSAETTTEPLKQLIP